MDQRLDQYCREMEKSTEGMLKHQVAEKNTEAAKTTEKPRQILRTCTDLKTDIK